MRRPGHADLVREALGALHKGPQLADAGGGEALLEAPRRGRARTAPAPAIAASDAAGEAHRGEVGAHRLDGSREQLAFFGRHQTPFDQPRAGGSQDVRFGAAGEQQEQTAFDVGPGAQAGIDHVDPRLRDQRHVDAERGQPLEAGAQLRRRRRRRAPPPPTPGTRTGRRAQEGSSWNPWQPADAPLRVGSPGGSFPSAAYRTPDQPGARRLAPPGRQVCGLPERCIRESQRLLSICTANGRTITCKAVDVARGAGGADRQRRGGGR